MLAENVHVGHHLWAKAGGWKPVQSVLRIRPIKGRDFPGKVHVILADGSHLYFKWHEVVHTATEYSTDV